MPTRLSIRYIYLIFIFLFLQIKAFANISPDTSLSIEQCYALAEENYPLTKQYEVIEKTAQLSLESLSTWNYPFISIFGQASYQSDVTSIPISQIDFLRHCLKIRNKM